MKEHLLCRRDDLPANGEARDFECAGHTICVANSAGMLSALDNICIHRGGPLSQGMIENGNIVCPWHGWAFDLGTGCATHDVARRARRYPLRIDGDAVYVSLEETL